MPRRKGRRSIEDLLNEASKGGLMGPKCWATKLTGDARRFVDEIRKRRRAGIYVNQSRVRDVLLREFGIDVVISSVRQHVVGNCRCQ